MADYASAAPAPWYGKKDLITAVSIGDGVTGIGSYAFCDCAGLREITIPEGVTAIGYLAFNGCSKLTEITIPDGITTIQYRTFQDCTLLTTATIPKSVTKIEESAFINSRLTTVYYGGSLEDWKKIQIELDSTNIRLKNAAVNCSTFREITFDVNGGATVYDVAAWAANGVVYGYGDGRLGPQGLVTRAQAAQILKNCLEK